MNLTSGGSPFMTIEERIKPSIRFVEGFGLAPATPDEARDILHLKGADTVSF